MKKLGSKVKVKKEDPEWDFMPDDPKELAKMMDEAEEDFKKGRNLLTAEQAKALVKKWK